jgi:glycosyltransferase involved in cell wall biosynthesis
MKPKIFLSLIENAGYYSRLKLGFDELNYDVDVGFTNSHNFKYSSETKISFIRKLLQKSHREMNSDKNISIRGAFFLIYSYFLLPIYFFQCVFKYDIFIFGFRKTFLPFHLDVIILKMLGKKTIFVFHGSDSRPAYLNGVYKNLSIKKLYKKTSKTKKSLALIGKYADHIIEEPANTIFHERKVIHRSLLGNPQKYVVHREIKNHPIITILHSPSKPEAKGTFTIREAINELLKEGCKFEYVEMINKTNEQVIDTIASCDFVIDQLFSDRPLAVFATEAAYFGKPAIIGGYEINEITLALPKEYRPPAMHVFPSKEDLKIAIKKLVDDNVFRESLGLQAMKFVREKWDATEVALKYCQIFNDDIPDEWYLDPYDFNFIYGCCIDDSSRKSIIEKYISKYGKEGLFLDDKKALKDKIIANLHACEGSRASII